MSTSLGKPRKQALPAPLDQIDTSTIANSLAYLLGQYIPGYTFITDLLRDRFGIDGDKILAVLGFFFGGWTLLNYVQNTVLPRILSTLTSQLVLDRNDQSYDDFTDWISRRRIFRYARSIKIVGRLGENRYVERDDWRHETFLSKALGTDYSHAEKEQDDENILFDFAALEARRPLLFEPTAGTYWFFHKKRLFLFSKDSNIIAATKNSGSKEESNITLTCLGLSTAPLKDLMETARAENYDGQAVRTSIFRPAGMNRFERWTSGPNPWIKVVSRPSRPLESVVLSHDQKEQILRDWNSFLHPRSQSWFAARGIPYRRGYLFSGPPGTGKTSICYALAGIFKIDCFVIALGDSQLSDSDLTGLLTDLPHRCLVILEDIDCIGSTRSEEDEEKRAALRDFDYGGRQKNMSLSGLLNAIDGVSSHEGHCLVMTTNYPDTLDDALKRPGRIDMHIEFKLASRRQIQEIFIRMYSIAGDVDPVTQKAKRTGTVTVEEACRESSDLSSGRSSPYMSMQDLLASAKTFAEAFEEELFSPAEIQGYLLKHKNNPRAAMAEVSTWIPKQLQARAKAEAEATRRKERRKAREAEMLARREQYLNESLRAGMPMDAAHIQAGMAIAKGGAGGTSGKRSRRRGDLVMGGEQGTQLSLTSREKPKEEVTAAAQADDEESKGGEVGEDSEEKGVEEGAGGAEEDDIGTAEASVTGQTESGSEPVHTPLVRSE